MTTGFQLDDLSSFGRTHKPQKTRIKVIGKYMERFGDTWRFRVEIEYGNAIEVKPATMLFEQFCHNGQLNKEKLKEINENLSNSLRIVKHFGGFFRKDTKQKEAQKMLNILSSTDTGIGIRVKNDPLKEFIPFVHK